jgi:hypothetical protein
LRPIAATLIVLLFCRTSVQAGPVSIRDVVLVLGRYQNPSPLELRQVSQSRATPVSELNGSAQEPSGTKETAGKGLPDPPNRNATAPATKNVSDSLLSGIVVRSDQPQGTVSIIDQGDLEGTICDCGEIVVAGGFPKWPLLFLGAIPFFFIHHSENSGPVFLAARTPTPTPTPQPTPSIPQVPEPSSLLLFVSGLSALAVCRLRRRVSASRAVEKARAKANG